DADALGNISWAYRMRAQVSHQNGSDDGRLLADQTPREPHEPFATIRKQFLGVAPAPDLPPEEHASSFHEAYALAKGALAELESALGSLLAEVPFVQDMPRP